MANSMLQFRFRIATFVIYSDLFIEKTQYIAFDRSLYTNSSSDVTLVFCKCFWYWYFNGPILLYFACCKTPFVCNLFLDCFRPFVIPLYYLISYMGWVWCTVRVIAKYDFQTQYYWISHDLIKSFSFIFG